MDVGDVETYLNRSYIYKTLCSKKQRTRLNRVPVFTDNSMNLAGASRKY